MIGADPILFRSNQLPSVNANDLESIKMNSLRKKVHFKSNRKIEFCPVGTEIESIIFRVEFEIGSLLIYLLFGRLAT